jgi:sugar phosphate isomerase/epimerase
MKKNLPITYYLDFSNYAEPVRRSFLHEVACCGIKHLVLNDRIIAQIMRNPGWAKVMQKELADEGLSFVDAHAPFGWTFDMNTAFVDERPVTMLRHQMHLHIARLMNVDSITIHIGNDYRYPEVPLQTHLDRIEEMLDNLLPVAEECKVCLCIENIWLRNTTPEMLWYFKDKFPTEYLGFCYDAGHANIMNNGRLHPASRAHDGWQAMGKAMPDWDDKILEKMLPYIVTCHLHDNFGAQDEHNLPGRGNVDWEHISKVLPSAPNIKLLQSEVIAQRNSIAIKELSEKFDLIFG